MVWIWFGLSDPAPRRYDQRSDQSGGDTDSSESVAEPDTPTKGKGIYYYYYYSNLFLLFYRLFWVFFHSWMQRILDHEEKQTTPRRLCKPSEDAMRQHKRRVVFRELRFEQRACDPSDSTRDSKPGSRLLGFWEEEKIGRSFSLPCFTRDQCLNRCQSILQVLAIPVHFNVDYLKKPFGAHA